MIKVNLSRAYLTLVVVTAAAMGGCGSTSTKARTSSDQRFVDAEASQRLLSEARGHFEAGKVQDAERTLELATKANPFDGRLHYNLGVLALQQGRFDSAAKRFERASELMPQAIEPQLGIASTLLQIGRYEAAAGAFKRALELDPTSRTASEGLVLSLGQTGEGDERRSNRR